MTSRNKKSNKRSENPAPTSPTTEPSASQDALRGFEETHFVNQPTQAEPIVIVERNVQINLRIVSLVVQADKRAMATFDWDRSDFLSCAEQLRQADLQGSQQFRLKVELRMNQTEAVQDKLSSTNFLIVALKNLLDVAWPGMMTVEGTPFDLVDLPEGTAGADIISYDMEPALLATRALGVVLLAKLENACSSNSTRAHQFSMVAQGPEFHVTVAPVASHSGNGGSGSGSGANNVGQSARSAIGSETSRNVPGQLTRKDLLTVRNRLEQALIGRVEKHRVLNSTQTKVIQDAKALKDVRDRLHKEEAKRDPDAKKLVQLRRKSVAVGKLLIADKKKASLAKSAVKSAAKAKPRRSVIAAAIEMGKIE